MKSIITFGLTLLTTAATALGAHVDPVYRFWNGRFHLYSTNAHEGTQKGYGIEGQVFYVSRRAFTGAVPLYRCMVPANGAEFLSLLPSCEGQHPVARLGFVMGNPVETSVPLYRCFNAVSTDHLATTDASECQAAGYSLEGALGNVYR